MKMFESKCELYVMCLFELLRLMCGLSLSKSQPKHDVKEIVMKMFPIIDCLQTLQASQFMGRVVLPMTQKGKLPNGQLYFDNLLSGQ